MICWYSSVHFVIWLANIKFCFYHRELGKIGRLAQKSSSSSDWRGSCRSLWAGTSGLRRGCRRFFAVFSRSLEINHRPSIAPGRPNTTAAAAPFVRSPSIGQKVDFSARQGNRLFGATRSWHQPTETLRLAISTSGNTCFWTKGPERGKQYEILYLLNLYSERLLKLRDEPQRYFCSDKSERRSAEMLERPWVCSVASHILGFGISMFL